MIKLQSPSKVGKVTKKISTVKKKSKKTKKVKTLIPIPQIKHPSMGIKTQGKAMSTASTDQAGGFRASTRGGRRV